MTDAINWKLCVMLCDFDKSTDPCLTEHIFISKWQQCGRLLVLSYSAYTKLRWTIKIFAKIISHMGMKAKQVEASTQKKKSGLKLSVTCDAAWPGKENI